MATDGIPVTSVPTPVPEFVVGTTYDIQNRGRTTVYIAALSDADGFPQPDHPSKSLASGEEKVIERTSGETVYVWTLNDTTSLLSYDPR